MLSRIIKSESLVAPLIFVLTFIVFLLSPVRQVTDSRYSMLLTQSLIDRGSFRLDHYTFPGSEHEAQQTSGWSDYRLETARGHIYYYLPPGTSTLSAPFVVLLNRFGLSAVSDGHVYDPTGEEQIQAILAAFLMAALSCLFFYTARLVLPAMWSVFVAGSGALGTQVYSTASRALWSHTWGILLLGIVVFLLLRLEARQRGLSPVLLASLLSWLYFIRPTFAVSILGISLYLLVFHPRLFPRYAVAGALWLAAFVLYSWTHFGRLLPSYYLISRLELAHFGHGLAANMISPSRGLVIYVPMLLFVGFLLVRYRRHLLHRRLVWLSLVIIAADVSVASAFPQWWAGHCFGSRFTTGSVPWFVLLGTLGLRANLASRHGRADDSIAGGRVELAFGVAAVALSVFINANGAIRRATWEWNEGPPINVDLCPERVWAWRQPQFLAGYLPTRRRTDPSLAYGRELAFQETGFFVYLLHKAAYGDIPNTPVPIRLSDFLQDAREIGPDGSQEKLEANKEAFVASFVSRPRFAARYPPSMIPQVFVDALNTNCDGALTQAGRDTLISELKTGVKTRAQVLLVVADDPELRRRVSARAFVLMQYFGYLGRDPDASPDVNFAGYNFWLNKLNAFGGDYGRAEIVRAFIQSGEYKSRRRQ